MRIIDQDTGQPITTMKELVCFFISYQKQIGNLYWAMGQARFHRSQGTQFIYTFTFPGFSTRTYLGRQILRLSREGQATPIGDLCCTTGDTDQWVRLLFAIMRPVQALYVSYANSESICNVAYGYCYTFTNPFPECISTSKSRIRLVGTEVRKTFCQCCNKSYIVEC